MSSPDSPLASNHLDFLLHGPSSDFPTLPGVYSIFDDMERDPYLTYIGQTTNFRSRMIGHKNSPHSGWTTTAVVRFIPIADERARLATERFLISYHCPPNNRQLYVNNKLGATNRDLPFALRNLDGKSWGYWTFELVGGWLKLKLPKKPKRGYQVYHVSVRGLYELSEISFDVENLKGMGMGRYVPDLEKGADTILALYRRGRDRITMRGEAKVNG